MRIRTQTDLDRAVALSATLPEGEKLFLELAIGALVISVVAMGGYIIYTEFVKSGGTDSIPQPDSTRLSQVRESFEKGKVLEDNFLQREVLAHTVSFATEEERVKILERVQEMKKDGTVHTPAFPRTFFQDASKASEFLSSYFGVTVDAKAYANSWDRGLPEKEKAKDEDKSDPLLSEMKKMNKFFADAKEEGEQGILAEVTQRFEEMTEKNEKLQAQVEELRASAETAKSGK